MYRQGDVLIERITKIPNGLKKQQPENGRIILAHGEKTGHAHAFSSDQCEKFLDHEGREYFFLTGLTVFGIFPVVRFETNQVVIDIPCGRTAFSCADVIVSGTQVSVSGEFALLNHQEHTYEAIPAGPYKGGGANGRVNQREYHPEAIRNVAD